jgi:hypothetical protein
VSLVSWCFSAYLLLGRRLPAGIYRAARGEGR